MKKVLTYVLIIILSVSLISCGGNTDDTNVTDVETVTEDQSVSAAESDTISETETEKETETEAEATESETVTETETEAEATESETVTETETEAEETVTETETEAEATETETEAATETETSASSGEKDPDTWLCEAGSWFATGWWMGTVINPDVPEWSIDANFITPKAFDGFEMACYAGAEPSATLRVSLLDNNGKELESQEIEVVGDHENEDKGFIPVSFEKAYSKGSYTIRFDFVEGSYFVLGCANEGDVDVSVAGNANVNETTLAAPAIALHGAVAP